MTKIRIQALPKFPASVEAGDGMIITRSAGVFMFAVDPDFFGNFGFALVDEPNTFADVQTIVTNSNVAGLNVLSGNSANNSNINVGRAAGELQLGVAGSADQYLTGTAAGDAILRNSGGGALWLGSAASAPGVKIAAGGTLTFPQHISGFLNTNGSGAVSALTVGTNKLVGTNGTTPSLINLPAAGLQVSGGNLSLANDLSALEALGSTGIATRTAADTWAQRTITGTSNEITATNGDGVSGNPTLSLPAALIFTGKTVTGGTFTSLPSVSITTGSQAAGVTVLSGNNANNSNILIGRSGGDCQLGVAGSNDQFLTGTVAGDTILRNSGGGALWLGGAAATYGIKITNGGVVSARGTTTNDSAAAGFVGELIESEILVGSAVSQTTGTSVNITSISLTAGDWDVFGTYFTNMAGGTTTTGFEAAIHTVSATLPARPNKGAGILMNCSGVGQNYGIPVGTRRFSLSGTTTVYLVASANFSGSTLSGYGYLGARRVR